MTLAALAAVLGVGLVAGLLSGLVGIGGGVLMVPFLYFFYAHPALSGVRLPTEAATVAAHATSLFVIVASSIRGAWSHHQNGAVVWRAVWPIAVVSAGAAAAAAQVATLLPPQALRLAFAGMLVFSGVTLWRRGDAPATDAEGNALPPRPLRLTLPVTLGTGLIVGSFSALLGVGGGIIAVPLLIWLVGIDLRRVAGTSLAIVTLTSVAGAGAYMLSVPEAVVRPGWSVGYVDVLVGVVLAAGAVVSVRWGTQLNQRMNPRALARLFAVFFLAVAAHLVYANLLRP